MSEENQDTGSSTEDQEQPNPDPNGDGVPDPGPEPKPEPETKKETKSKPDKVPDQILKCSNDCGFMTRWPKAQALIVKGDKVAKEPFLCPNCDTNGMSSRLVQYP